MAKPQFQDIVPPDRRSIKKIPLPERRREMPQQAPAPRVREEEIFDEPKNQEPAPRRSRRKPKSTKSFARIFVSLLILVIILGIGFWSLSRASGAQITITPKQQNVSVDSTFTATKSAGDLQFQTVTIEKIGKLGVQATGQEMAQTKASGAIVIYNTTPDPQKLVAGTRFQTPEGLIFRISDPITVPGGTASTPGSVQAVITADAIGPDYNVGVKDFTIPGFKGTPKYTQLYARTNPQVPIQGGFSGMRPKVADADLKKAKDKIDNELRDNLINEAQKDIPTGFVLPGNAYFIEYESLPLNQTTDGAEVNERATFHGFIFNSTQFATQILKKASGEQNIGDVNITNSSSLAFAITSPTSTSTSPWLADSISFSIKGSTTLVSVVDTGKLKDDLAGKPRNSLNAVLTGYPSIVKAQVNIRPFWKTVFPTNKDEMTITVTNPELSP